MEIVVLSACQRENSADPNGSDHPGIDGTGFLSSSSSSSGRSSGGGGGRGPLTLASLVDTVILPTARCLGSNVGAEVRLVPKCVLCSAPSFSPFFFFFLFFFFAALCFARVLSAFLKPPPPSTTGRPDARCAPALPGHAHHRQEHY